MEGRGDTIDEVNILDMKNIDTQLEEVYEALLEWKGLYSGLMKIKTAINTA